MATPKVRIVCPGCNKRLLVPPGLSSVLCPACGTRFDAGLANSPKPSSEVPWSGISTAPSIRNPAPRKIEADPYSEEAIPFRQSQPASIPVAIAQPVARPLPTYNCPHCQQAFQANEGVVACPHCGTSVLIGGDRPAPFVEEVDAYATEEPLFPTKRERGNGNGVPSLVFGILSLLFVFLGFTLFMLRVSFVLCVVFAILGLILGILAIVFGGSALRSDGRDGCAKTGLVTGWISTIFLIIGAMVVAVNMLMTYTVLSRNLDRRRDDPRHRAIDRAVEGLDPE